MNKIGIYKITNTTDNKVYVGQSVDISNRFRGHKAMLNKGEHHCKSLQEDWERLGADAFEFETIEECHADELDILERLMIEYYDSYNPEHGYNKKRGGKRGKQANEYHTLQVDNSTHFFINDKGKREYNELCAKCKQSCKQSFRVDIISCDKFA